MNARAVCLFAAGAVGFFDERVAPILTRHCLACHNHELNDGTISFEDRASLLSDRGGSRPAIVPGKPQESPLIRAIEHRGDVQMPPGRRLSAREIAILKEWIKRGALWGASLRAEQPTP